jgi:hypothetical protein
MIEIPPFPLTQHDLFGPDACAVVREKVMDLNSYWRTCSKTFFTLGAASYIDAPRQRATYLDAANETNALLGQAFASEYELLKHFLEELLGESVSFDTRLALPGFHIFILNGVDQTADNVAARAHFDLQWMHAIPGCVPTGTLSFTLPIEEPTGGASMEIWPFRYADAWRLGISALTYASQNVSEKYVAATTRADKGPNNKTTILGIFHRFLASPFNSISPGTSGRLAFSEGRGKLLKAQRHATVCPPLTPRAISAESSAASASRPREDRISSNCSSGNELKPRDLHCCT